MLCDGPRSDQTTGNESYNADNQAVVMGSRASGIPYCRIAYSVACLPGTFFKRLVYFVKLWYQCPSRAGVRKNRLVEGLSVEITPVDPKRCIIYRSIKWRRFSAIWVHISSEGSGSVSVITNKAVMASIICVDKRGGKFEKTSEGQVEEDVLFGTTESPHTRPYRFLSTEARISYPASTFVVCFTLQRHLYVCTT
jgi:hypothetical protein